MAHTLVFNQSDLSISYRCRTSTNGAELDLVYNYIRNFLKKSRRLNVAIFIEPQIESGYPDIVIAEYSKIPINKELAQRANLSNVDLKILFQVMQVNSISIKALKELLGYSELQIKKSLNVLEICNMVKISTTGKFVRKRNIKSFFFIKKITSIEAKISKWHEAIDQSFTNQWFSGESYILLNKRPNTRCEQICCTTGTGIISLFNNAYSILLDSSHRKIPASYVSLLFNEWIIRKLLKEQCHE